MEKKVIKKFEVGRQYSMRSACDHDCVWTYQVVARTRCTITIVEVGCSTLRQVCRVWNSEWLGAECCNPLGRYSMSPVLSAE